MDKLNQLLQSMGHNAATEMQQAVWMAAPKAGGLVLLSPTGSGKTLAYLCPLTQVVDASVPALQAVVILPTRELAAQSVEVLKSMKTGLRAVALYGGRAASLENKGLREDPPQVVFATPGRLNDHLRQGHLDPARVGLLVIDEFDKCLELGFEEEMQQAVGALPRVTRCWLMSATRAESIPAFMQRVTTGAVTLDYLELEAGRNARIDTFAVHSLEKDKLGTLALLLTALKGAPAIVFVAHRESVERVRDHLMHHRFAVAAYHGGMDQQAREKALYSFRSGSANVLVSTDLAARGLDIPEVKVVVHYHLPLRAEDYCHRNGRTARWEAEGAVMLIVGPTESVPGFVPADLPEYPLPADARVLPARPKYTTLYIGRGKAHKLSKGDILGFFCKKGGLNALQIGRIDVFAQYALVSVDAARCGDTLRRVAGEKIKGMKTIIEQMKRY